MSMLKLEKVINNQSKILFVEGKLSQLKGNKAPYFSITGSTWKYSKARQCKTGRDCETGGCIHDEILKAFPDLKDFVSLHLSDMDGAPMYAVENGWYYIEKLGTQFTIETTMKHLRISKEEAQKVIDTINTKDEFIEYVDSQRERWLSEANAVIAKYNLKVVQG